MRSHALVLPTRRMNTGPIASAGGPGQLRRILGIWAASNLEPLGRPRGGRRPHPPAAAWLPMGSCSSPGSTTPPARWPVFPVAGILGPGRCACRSGPCCPARAIERGLGPSRSRRRFIRIVRRSPIVGPHRSRRRAPHHRRSAIVRVWPRPRQETSCEKPVRVQGSPRRGSRSGPARGRASSVCTSPDGANPLCRPLRR